MKRRREDLPPCEVKEARDLLKIKDTQKLEYAVNKVSQDFECERARHVPADERDPFNWLARRSPDEIIAERNRAMWRIRRMAMRLRESGATTRLFQESDAVTERVAASVNGPHFRIIGQGGRPCGSCLC